MNQASYLEQDEVKGEIRDFRSFTYLLRYATSEKLKISVALILLMGKSVFDIASAWFVGRLVEEGLAQKDWDIAIQYSVIIIIVEALAVLSIWNGRRMLADASCAFILNIRRKLFSHLQLLPMRFFDRQPQGRTVTRVTHDVEGLENFFTSSLGRVISASLTFTLALIAMLATDFTLGLILVSSMIPAAVFTLLSRSKIREINREVSSNTSHCNSKLSEFLNGLPVIRYFALENWAKKEYDSVVNKYRESVLAANLYYGFTRPPLSLLCLFPTIGLLYFGGKDVMAGTMSIGLFVTFIRYCERFSFPLAALLREIHIIQQAFTSAERVTTFLQEEDENEILGENGTVINNDIKGLVEFQNITMGYNDKQTILKNVSFRLSPGEKIGLVGRTGSGKTTTISLLARLYDFQKGEITIDGFPIREYDRDYLRSSLGFVGQDVVIFNGTIRENLVCERPLSDHEVKKACEETGLWKILERNKMDLHTVLYGRGANISVGERQLLALTRVLLSDPKILILDEATANIDPELELIIHHCIEKIMKGRSCLIIAHRIDTLKICDKILTFSDGEIIESGSHQELIAQKGHFYDLYTHNQF